MSTSITTLSIVPSGLSRGSVWRRWDLHVHSPLSALNNQFPQLPNNGGPEWEQYLTHIETLNLAVIGITDYFTIEGYRAVLNFRGQGRLANVQLVLPNIEFRLDKVVGSPARRLNLHVIFSTEVSPDDIEEHFLRNLSVYIEGRPQAPDEAWRISRAQLEQLGRRLRLQHEPFRDRSDFEIGCMNATVRAQEIKQVLDERPSIFEDRYLIVFAEENSSLMSWDGQDHLTRKVLLQGADAIFSANPRTREWALGRVDLSPEQFRTEFKTLKPCIHGSDAHNLGRIGEPDGRRYCWIKTDPTFEGLKQIVYEPGDRVFIGEHPPKLKSDYQLIEAIQVSDAPAWCDAGEIPLNGELVAIIGGRGSGKSALAELIAFVGGADVFRTSKDIKDSFLSKASKKSSSNPSPITGAAVSLKWRDGGSVGATVPESLKHGLNEERVKYLPQKFVERLCAPENTQHLQEEIERIIFQNLNSSQRLDAVNFANLRDRTTRSVNLKKQDVRLAIEAINTSTSDLVSRIAEKAGKETQLKQREAEYASLLKQQPDVPQEDEDALRQLEDLTRRKQSLERAVAQHNEQLVTLDEIETRFSLFEPQLEAFNADIAEMLAKVDLGDQGDAFRISLPLGVPDVLGRRRTEIQQAITLLRDGTADAPTAEFLRGLDNLIGELKARLQSTEARRQEYEKFQRDRSELEQAIAGLSREIADIENMLRARLERERVVRLEKYLDFFDVLREEKRQLQQLYQPLHDALERANEVARKLGFVSKVSYNAALHAQRGEEIVDQRKLRYRENTLEQDLKTYFRRVEEGLFDREAIRTAITGLYSSFLRDGQRELEIKAQLRKDRSLREFDDWIFGTQDFAVSYDLTFDGKDLQLLSPGERGIMLLLLYLEAEKADNRPLVIDQPDDNLDNLSVYPSLIEYFRERKKTRQIIIITHNPNLVVNTDAEQIIVANYDGSRTPRIRYRAGSLENIDIRDSVCQILEGGTEAFQRREQKYCLPPM